MVRFRNDSVLKDPASNYEDSLEDIAGMNMRPLIYLIHGTWGHGAAFAQAKSEFRTIIATTVKLNIGEEPEYRRFEWSGFNTVAARALWADALRKAVEDDLVTSNPPRPCFLIAHSHGGSLAAIAIKNSVTIQKNITGVVAMATPFVEIGPTTSANRAASFTYFLTLCFISILLSGIFAIVQLSTSGPSIEFIFYGPMIVTILHTIDRRLSIVRRTLIKLRRQRKVLDTASFTTKNLLIVSTPGDEAGLVFKLASYSIQILRLFGRVSGYLGWILPTGSTGGGRYNPLKSIAVILYRFAAYLIFTIGAFLLLLSWSSLFDAEQWKHAFDNEAVCKYKAGLGEIEAAIAGVGCSVAEDIRVTFRMMVVTLPLLTLASVFLVAPLVGGVIYKAVGWVGPLHVMFSRIYITTLPLQGGDFARLPNRSRKFFYGFRHSEVYIDKKTVQKIADWIASCCKQHPSQADV